MLIKKIVKKKKKTLTAHVQKSQNHLEKWGKERRDTLIILYIRICRQIAAKDLAFKQG